MKASFTLRDTELQSQIQGWIQDFGFQLTETERAVVHIEETPHYSIQINSSNPEKKEISEITLKRPFGKEDFLLALQKILQTPHKRSPHFLTSKDELIHVLQDASPSCILVESEQLPFFSKTLRKLSPLLREKNIPVASVGPFFSGQNQYLRICQYFVLDSSFLLRNLDAFHYFYLWSELQTYLAEKALHRREFHQTKESIFELYRSNPLYLKTYSLGLNLARTTQNFRLFRFFSEKLLSLNPTYPKIYLMAAHFQGRAFSRKLLLEAQNFCPRHREVNERCKTILNF